MFALTFQRFAWKTFVQELLDIYYIHPHFSDGLYGLFIVLILFKECHSRPKDWIIQNDHLNRITGKQAASAVPFRDFFERIRDARFAKTRVKRSLNP